MTKNLVIVESPAKAKTIEGYLGKDYKVVSSYGHVRDLPKDDSAIDIENGFKPTYEVSSDKKNVIKDLKKLVKESDLVYLASDDDREGEAISWHLKEVLNLKDDIYKRIVFREITKTAIDNAINSPRGIDLNLVNAQQARRVLDRLVGFELSPILWKKIKTGLSAGRVQSVAVRLVVERERDIEKFKADTSFRVVAEFDVDGAVLKAELPSKIKDIEEVREFLQELIDAKFNIADLVKKPSQKSPAPPFTTSTLQQEASRKLGYSVSQTMTLAQKLYESGKITYMRTDSVNLSDEAMASAAGAIKSDYGEKYYKGRKYKSKTAGAQEAHEAIRPTNFSHKNISLDRGAERLYELIWKRAIASQMSNAQIEKTLAKIDISTSDRQFTAQGEVVLFDGFLKVYLESTDDEENTEKRGMLPPLKVGQELQLDHLLARESFTRAPARYSEANLVKTLEEKGIGRPSTYAPTISTIQKRGYVTKETREGKERKYQSLLLKNGKITEEIKTETTGAEKNKLFPTNIAMIVNDFLVEHFPNVTNYSFTADVEKEFDDIAQGGKNWSEMIGSFYGKFHEKVVDTEEIDRTTLNKPRELGKDPKTGRVVYARMAKFGPVIQLGSEEEDGKKPDYASLRKGQFLENITLEDALDLLKMPRQLGEFEEKEVTVNIGRFGPYVRHDNKFVSIPKEEDPYTIGMDRAIELIEQKRKDDANKFIKVFDENPDIQVINGRYGPYIKAGKKNVKIPKDKKPEDLTLQECLELAEKAPDKKKGFRKKKK